MMTEKYVHRFLMSLLFIASSAQTSYAQQSSHHPHHQLAAVDGDKIVDAGFADSARFSGSDGNLVRRHFASWNLSGSSQYTESQARDIMRDIIEANKFGPSDVVMFVDLREEAHLFVGAKLPGASCVSGEPLIIKYKEKIGDKTQELIDTQEHDIIHALEGKTLGIDAHRYAIGRAPQLSREIQAVQAFDVTVNTRIKPSFDGIVKLGYLETEEQMINRVYRNLRIESDINPNLVTRNKTKVVYRRIPIEDLSVPSLNHVKALEAVIKAEEEANPNGRVWVHIHCHGGLGRTAFMMQVVAMLRSHASLAEINKVMSDFGGRNLLDIEKPEIGQSLKAAKDIKASLEAAYLYIHPERKAELNKTPVPTVAAQQVYRASVAQVAPQLNQSLDKAVTAYKSYIETTSSPWQIANE